MDGHSRSCQNCTTDRCSSRRYATAMRRTSAGRAAPLCWREAQHRITLLGALRYSKDGENGSFWLVVAPLQQRSISHTQGMSIAAVILEHDELHPTKMLQCCLVHMFARRADIVAMQTLPGS